MKKSFLYTYIILSTFTLSASWVSALSYKDALPYENKDISIRQESREEAQLVKGYIQRYRQNIQEVYANYSSEESKTMNDALTITSLMLKKLEEMENASLSQKNFDTIMKTIVDDLALLNGKMKTYLEEQKVLHEKKLEETKKKYSSIGKKISILLEEFLKKMSLQLSKKKTLSDNDKKIIQNLIDIREENDRILDFEKRIFSSEEDMKRYFQKIVRNIQSEMQAIVEISRSN